MGKQHKHASGRSPHAAYGPFRPGGILRCRLQAPRPWASHTCFWAASLPSESIGYVPGAVLQPVVRGGRPLLSREGGRKGKRLRVQAASVTRKEGSGQWESSLGVVPPTTPPGGDRPLSVLVVAVSPSPHSSCSLSPGPCLWEKGREKKGKVVGDILKEEPKVANRWL